MVLVIGFVNGADTRNLDYIAVASGIATEAVSGLFFYLYNKTVRQLKEYHDSLLTVQNILLAFKLIEDIEKEEQKTEMLALVLSALVDGHTSSGRKPIIPAIDNEKLRSVS